MSTTPRIEDGRLVHPMARRLTWEQACEIRRRHGVNRFKYTIRGMAREFGVVPSTIRDIVNWKNYCTPVERNRHVKTSEAQRAKMRAEAKERYDRHKARLAAITAEQRDSNEAAEDARAWR